MIFQLRASLAGLNTFCTALLRKARSRWPNFQVTLSNAVTNFWSCHQRHTQLRAQLDKKQFVQAFVTVTNYVSTAEAHVIDKVLSWLEEAIVPWLWNFVLDDILQVLDEVFESRSHLECSDQVGSIGDLASDPDKRARASP